MKHLGNVECIDCGGNHEIFANDGGMLTSLVKCPGPTPSGSATGAQSTEMSDAVRHTETCITELKSRFEEGDWDQVRALADEATIKLNTIALTASEIAKS